MTSTVPNNSGPRKVALITGGTGFIGSHLIRHLRAAHWEVHAVTRSALSASRTSDFRTVEWHWHDGSMLALAQILSAVQPTVVFHLASLFLAQHAADDVDSLILSNVLFGTQLLEAMDRSNCKCLVNTGTSWQNYDERGFNPVNLYAATKQAFEEIARYYVEARELQMITLRLFDTYGPNDPRPKLLSLLNRASITGEVLEMSPGEQFIDLVFVDDVVRCFALAAGRLLQGKVSVPEIYAVSSGAPLQLRQLVELFSAAVGRPINVSWGKRPYRPREVMRPWSTGNTLPGWKAEIALDAGLRRFIEDSNASCE